MSNLAALRLLAKARTRQEEIIRKRDEELAKQQALIDEILERIELPEPKHGVNGADGRDGLDGKDGRDGVDGTPGRDGKDGRDGEDGVTTIVTKEVLANKENLLEKDEFEEFKKLMLKMERDVRNSLAKTHGYFAGGVASIANVIEVSENSIIGRRQLDTTKINVILVTSPDILVVLPNPTKDVVVITQQGYSGDATFRVKHESDLIFIGDENDNCIVDEFDNKLIG